MVDFVKHALFTVVIGFQLMVYGMLSSYTGDNSVQAMMVIAFLCYAPAAILAGGMIVGPLRTSKIIAIINSILLLAACVFCIAGLGVQGSALGAYSGTFTATAAIVAVLAAVMYILSLCCGGTAKVQSDSSS